MRKIIVTTFLSLDGVMQAPGGPQEDTSGGFAYGGWCAPFSDEISGQMMQQQMEPTDILLGRKTFDIFAAYWPQHANNWPGINDVTKYVLSNTLTGSNWQNSVFLTSVDEIRTLKQMDSGPIKVWGSSELAQLLLQHDLVDELWLKIYPVILGNGKKLFGPNISPVGYTLMQSVTTPSGVIFANYERSGNVRTGEIGE